MRKLNSKYHIINLLILLKHKHYYRSVMLKVYK